MYGCVYSYVLTYGCVYGYVLICMGVYRNVLICMGAYSYVLICVGYKYIISISVRGLQDAVETKKRKLDDSSAAPAASLVPSNEVCGPRLRF